MHHHDEEFVVFVGDGQLHLSSHLLHRLGPGALCRDKGHRERSGGQPSAHLVPGRYLHVKFLRSLGDCQVASSDIIQSCVGMGPSNLCDHPLNSQSLGSRPKAKGLRVEWKPDSLAGKQKNPDQARRENWEEVGQEKLPLGMNGAEGLAESHREGPYLRT